MDVISHVLISFALVALILVHLGRNTGLGARA
jgi:preprotein translocase subunit SecG